MADVILIYPALDMGYHLRPPLGILTLASWLIPQGYTVKIIDQRVDKDWKHILRTELKENPICVGICAMSGYPIKAGIEACQYIRKLSTIPIVWGGVHATIESRSTIENELVDIIVIGEGDVTFPELVENLKLNKSLHDVKGIAFKEEGKVVYTPTREIIDMNTRPPILFDVVDLDKYREKDLHYELEGELVFSIETSRGCSHHCRFCSESRSSLRWRSMRAQKAVGEIKRIVQTYGIRSFTIIDDNFFVNRKRAEEFVNLLIQEEMGIEWYTNVRPDYIAKVEPRFLAKLRESGCKCLTMGAESGSSRVLKQIKKGATKEQFIISNKKLKEASIVPWFVTILGFPMDDIASTKETFLMIIKLINDNLHTKSGTVQLIPTPGSDIAEVCYSKEYKKPESLSEWGEIRDRYDWVNKEVKKFIKKHAYFDELVQLRNQRVFLSSAFLKIFSRLLEFRIRRDYYSFFVEPNIVDSLVFRGIVVVLRKIRSRQTKYLYKSGS